MVTINLEEILKKELIPVVFAHSPEMTFLATLRAMKEACRQTLQLVVKDANMIVTENDLVEEGQLYTTYDDGVITVRINENSILDVLNKVK